MSVRVHLSPFLRSDRSMVLGSSNICSTMPSECVSLGMCTSFLINCAAVTEVDAIVNVSLVLLN